jgi:hypothetical protein
MQTAKFYLSGGVGNQLFGIYAGFYFQEKAKIQTKFIYQTSDTYSFDSCLTHEIDFKLPYFVEQAIYKKTSFVVKLNQKLRKQIKPYNLIFNKYSKHYISPNMSYDQNLFELKNKKTVNGYFQTYFYFDELINMGFSPPSLVHSSNWYKEQLELVKTKFPIMMHLRRGDYLNHPKIFKKLDARYYDQAINNLDGSLENNPIWIFSDNESQAEEMAQYLPKREYHIIRQKNQTPIEVLFLMSQGSAQIISNSTFSWWSAKISENTQKVIAPKIWFLDRETPSDLIPKSWVQI